MTSRRFARSPFAGAVALAALAAVPTLAAGCGSPDERDSLEIGAVGDDNDPHPITTPLVLGGEVELEVREPDPKNPGYVHDAVISGWRASPAQSVLVSMHPIRRNLVVEPLVEGPVTLTIMTESGREHAFSLSVERPARIEAEPYESEGAALAPLPPDLRGRTIILVGGAAVGFDLHAYGPGGAALTGTGFADVHAEPEPLVTITSGASHDNKIKVSPADGPGDVVLRVAPRASVAAAAAVNVPVSIVADAPSPDAIDVVAYHHACNLFGCAPYQTPPISGGRGELTVKSGTSAGVALFATERASGDLVLTREAAVVAIDGDSVDAAGAFLLPNFVYVSGHAPGDATLTLSYLGQTLTILAHVVP
jgi:hypothetical protein